MEERSGIRKGLIKSAATQSGEDFAGNVILGSRTPCLMDIKGKVQMLWVTGAACGAK